MISNNIILRLGMICSVFYIATGCMPEMDLNNPEQLSVDTYYTTEAELDAAVIPAYEALIGPCGELVVQLP